MRFQRLVAQVMNGLPRAIRESARNVEVVVEDEPSGFAADGHSTGAEELFGLYEGVPLALRGSDYSLVLPDKITLFQGPLERAFEDPNERFDEIRVTLLHEFGHHLGLEEEEIAALGLE